MNISGKNRMAIVTIIFLLSQSASLYSGLCCSTLNPVKIAPLPTPPVRREASPIWVVEAQDRIKKAQEEQEVAAQKLRAELKRHKNEIDFFTEKQEQKKHDKLVEKITATECAKRRLSRSDRSFSQEQWEKGQKAIQSTLCLPMLLVRRNATK
ncbi:MAG: hypothetical protein NTX86_02005 [Candidatus Dependentiae bacterium]|nr:hypothetical protein [Candidatus Dependentiae bacterium]